MSHVVQNAAAELEQRAHRQEHHRSDGFARSDGLHGMEYSSADPKAKDGAPAHDECGQDEEQEDGGVFEGFFHGMAMLIGRKGERTKSQNPRARSRGWSLS